MVVFDWDRNNPTKIRAHRIKAEEVEQALAREPVLIYQQDADDEERYVYYGEIVLTERGDRIRVITAYGLDARQKHDYLLWRARGE
jgi:uncharacterized DUF497 family protein